jgi:hypothetical protein
MKPKRDDKQRDIKRDINGKRQKRDFNNSTKMTNLPLLKNNKIK